MTRAVALLLLLLSASLHAQTRFTRYVGLEHTGQFGTRGRIVSSRGPVSPWDFPLTYWALWYADGVGARGGVLGPMLQQVNCRCASVIAPMRVRVFLKGLGGIETITVYSETTARQVDTRDVVVDPKGVFVAWDTNDSLDFHFSNSLSSLTVFADAVLGLYVDPIPSVRAPAPPSRVRVRR